MCNGVHTRRYPLLLVTLLLLAGCAKKYEVQIDALGAAHQEKVYTVVPADPAQRPDDLYVKEFSDAVATTLKSQGFKVARSKEEATAAVLLTYRMNGTPTVTVEDDVSPRLGVGVGSGGWGGRGWGTGVGLGLSFPMGSWGGGSSMMFTRVVVLDAVGLPANKDPYSRDVISLWKVTLTSMGGNPDLRAAFPVMLRAGAPHLGTDTHGPVTVTLEQDAKE